uniref:Uncharacterized protein n=1 Tax=Oryza rufipogon TaxID=4529 RepID=A0A0E0PJM4_ORYRU
MGLGHSAHPMRCGPRLVVGYPDTVYPTKTERGGVGDGAGLGALGIGVDGGDVGCSGDEQRHGGRAREQVHEVREVEVQ